MEQMSLMMHEMKHLHSEMKKFMTGSDNSDSELETADLDRKFDHVLHEQKRQEVSRRVKFNEELHSCKVDLHHAKLWVGSSTLDEYELGLKTKSRSQLAAA